MEKTLMHSDKMKILFVLGFTNPFPGAGWTRISSFAQSWVNKGHLIEILGVFSFSTFSKKKAFSLGNINFFNLILRLGDSNPFIFLLNCAFSFFVSILYLLIRTPNVTIISVPSGDVGLGAMMACKLFRVNYIVDYRDRWEDYQIDTAKGRFIKIFFFIVKKISVKIYKSSLFSTVVTYKTFIILKSMGLSNIKLIPNGADTNVFQPKKKPEHDQLTLIYMVGPAYYDIDLLFETIVLLSGQKLPFRLFIIGKVTEQLKNKLKYFDIDNRSILFGEVINKNELSKIISQGDVGLLPLSIDYIQAKSVLPVKLFEYCACGLPVIATASSNSILAELIEKNQIGLVVNSMDKIKFAEAICSLYKNEVVRKIASEHAIALIKEKFDRNKIAENFLTALLESVGRNQN